MALARIITRFPEEAHELVESLRSRGFEVQTESPGKTSPQPADLEITIEECDAEEALQRATSVQDACAFVMPGAITGGVQPITSIPFIPQMNIEESATVGSEARAVSEQIESLPRHSFGMEAPRVEAAEFSATPISDLESQPLINENARAMISEPEHAAAELQPVSLNQQSEEPQPQMISASASEPRFPQTELDSRAVEAELISADSHLREGAAGEISDAPRAAEPVLSQSGDVQGAVRLWNGRQQPWRRCPSRLPVRHCSLEKKLPRNNPCAKKSLHRNRGLFPIGRSGSPSQQRKGRVKSWGLRSSSSRFTML